MPRHHQKKGSAPGGSQRQLRVGELVRHAVADILAQGSVHDADLEGHIITVPEVRMSPDLKLATIYVMPLGGRDTEIVLAALERNKKFLRGEIAHRVNLKFAPDIRFRADERFDEAERIEQLLRTPPLPKALAPEKGEEECPCPRRTTRATRKRATRTKIFFPTRATRRAAPTTI